MPSETRDAYERGYHDGYLQGAMDAVAQRLMDEGLAHPRDFPNYGASRTGIPERKWPSIVARAKPSKQTKAKRKLSKWQKFVKANSKKKKFIYQSGAKKGKLNLKKMGVEYRRKNK